MTYIKRIFSPLAMLILYNKPYQMLSQFNPNLDGPEQRLLPEHLCSLGVKPLGRLDYDSEGLLLLSDEASLEKQLLDPTKKHKRTYLVQVEGRPSEEALAQIERGEIEIRVGKKSHRCAPAQVSVLEELPNWVWLRNPAVDPASERRSTWLLITLTEGKNRQVRRMTAKIGCPTLRLIRQRIGGHEVDAIAPGEFVRL